jgi:hypothetical protein
MNLLLLVFRKLKGFNEILFDQILFASLILVFLALMYIKLKKNCKFGGLEVFIAAVLFFNLATYSLVNIDRSRSFYILAWIDKKELVLNAGRVDLTDIQSPEKRNAPAIISRLEEQIDRNLVVRQGDELKLTLSGKVYLGIADFLAKIYSLNGWRDNT